MYQYRCLFGLLNFVWVGILFLGLCLGCSIPQSALPTQLGASVSPSTAPALTDIYFRERTSSSLDIAWSVQPNASHYRILLDGKLVADNLTDVNYILRELRPATRYTVRVQAIDAQGNVLQETEQLLNTLEGEAPSVIGTPAVTSPNSEGSILSERQLDPDNSPAFAPVTGPDGSDYYAVGNKILAFPLQGKEHLYPLDFAASGPPLVTQDYLFVTDTRGHFYRFNLVSGRREFKILMASVALNPVVQANTTTVAFSKDGTDILGIDLKTGQQKWIFFAHSLVSRELHQSPQGDLLLTTQAGHLYALDPETGEMRWFFLAKGPLVNMPPAIDSQGHTYIATTNGHVYALNQYGFQVWHRDLNAKLRFGVRVGPDDHLYLLTEKGELIALDTETGDDLWRHPLSTWLVGPAQIGIDGTIYLLLSNGSVQAVSPEGANVWTTQLPEGFGLQQAVLNRNGLLQLIGLGGRLLSMATQSPGPWQVNKERPLE
jgi:outer membrane protein assembly factor BamB